MRRDRRVPHISTDGRHASSALRHFKTSVICACLEVKTSRMVDLSNLRWKSDVISLTCHRKKGDMCDLEMGR
jgi:hypothetical protein